jgi:arylsulfatase A-like enzyme/tetratricopeptide (TPR) repeat protein
MAGEACRLSTAGKGPADRPDRKRFRWSQFLLYAGAIVLVFLGGLRLAWTRWIVPSGSETTGVIMPELVPAERIELETGALRDWNVLLISVDTTRADHLGCYGNRSIETPVLDELARTGVLCAQAVTPVPATLPGHSSLLTGLFPYRHGARANGTFKLEDRNVTLAEVLREQGYRTGAAISAFVLDSQYGTDQGFETYNDDLTIGVKYSPQMFRERAAELTNVPVREWLAEHAAERFFFWTHYFDPHAVYLAPEPFRSRYARSPYDGEIAYADSQIGELLKTLEELGLRERTLVIVVSDHGEGLGDHGEATHSLLIYDSTLQVPMIFNAPGALPGGKVLHCQVSLVDVMPTVLDLLDVPVPYGPDGEPLDGRSLLRPPPAGPRPVYVETLSTMTLHGWAPLLGVRRDDYKFILAPEPEVYDLRSDPGELRNLYQSRPELAMDLRDELVKLVGQDPWLAARAKQNMPLDPAAQRRLQALGYVSSVPEEDIQTDLDELPDPKLMIKHWERVQQGVAMRNAGNNQGAIEQLTACLEEVPRDVWALQILGGAYASYGQYEQALETFERVVELSPTEPGAHLGMANMHVALGDYEKALEVAERVRAMDPENGAVFMLLGRLAYLRGNEDEAFELLQKAIELDPGTHGPGAYNQMGEIHFRTARFEQAREAFNQAIEIDGLNGDAHDGLARVLIQEGKPDEAKRELALALRFTPGDVRALATLGGILSDEGDYAGALSVLERALEAMPKFGFALNNLALTYRRQGRLELAEQKYKEAIECSPRLDLPYVNLAQLYLSQGKEEEAIKYFRRAVRANPSSYVALANVGTYELRNGRAEEARQLLQRAVRIKPDYALGHKHLGAALLELGDKQPAIAHLKKSLELDPSQPDAGRIRFQLEMLQGPEERP